MADLIDVACDICGQKYRWGRERIGTSSPCQECGTKFKIVEYTPPPEDDSTAASPLRWIRGACVAALVVGAVVGLGSLPFVRPVPGRAIAADRKQPGTGFSQPVAQAPGALPPPQQNLQGDVQPRLKTFREQAGLPGMRRPGFSQPGFPQPGNPGSMPQFPTQPQAPAKEGFGLPDEPEAEATPVKENKPPVAADHFGTATGTPPVITGWNSTGARARQQLRLTGRGLKSTTKVQKLLGVSLFDVHFVVVSDGELELKSLHFRGPGQMLLVVTTAEGAAVAFSDDVTTVNSPVSGDLTAGPDRVYLVKRGGILTSQQPAVVLLDEGGRANVSSITSVGILKKGAELETAMATTLISEAGARVIQRAPIPRDDPHPAVITFCPLPRLSDGR